MTLVVATAFAEGIVIGADSRATVLDPHASGQPRVGTDYAEKLFEIHGYGIGTSGCGHFGGTVLADHLKAFEQTLAVPVTFDQIAVQLGNFFHTLYKADAGRFRATPLPADAAKAKSIQDQIDAAIKGLDVYFLLAGMDNGKPRVDRIFVTAQDSKTNPLGFQRVTQIATGFAGVAFIGASDVCERLIHGYSMTLLKSAGIPAQLDQILRSTATNIPFDVWKTQDALDLVWTLFHVTMYMQRVQVTRPGLSIDYQSVGGEVDLIIIDKAGLRWECRKETSFRATLPDAPKLARTEVPKPATGGVPKLSA